MKKSLSEEISKGIYEGFWKPILIVIYILLTSLLVFTILGHFINKNSQISIAPQSCFPYENLRCEIRNQTWVYGIVDLCGYQEANAWFEQYKQKIKGEFSYLECW